MLLLGGLVAAVCPVGEASSLPATVVDLNGPWLMKDYTLGVGVTKQVQLPGREPEDCLPVQVPGTVSHTGTGSEPRGALITPGPRAGRGDSGV